MKRKIESKIKKFILMLTGQVRHLKPTAQCDYEWYGNPHAGFYVCPQLLDENSIVYSFGIGEDVSFDLEIIAKHKCQVYGFDPTPKSINWVGQQELPGNFHFYKYGIHSESGFVDFFLPKNKAYVSGSLMIQNNVDTGRKVSVEMKSIGDIVRELGHDHIDVLKMDIEGSEYDVIDSILKANLSITQLLIEFHDRFFEDGRERTRRAIGQLKACGFEVFAVSDSFEEVSLVYRG